MSGRRMLAPEKRSGGPNASGARRTVIVAVAALSLLTCGAVAQAAGDDGPDRDDPRAGAVATTEPIDTAGGVGADDSTPPGDPPDGLGTDAELDALAQDCFDGDLVACDHLFLDSPVDSDYEEYGDTCAGRQEAGMEVYCGLVSGEDIPAIPDEPVEPTPPGDLGNDPALDALANDCYAGAMDACDQLYDESDAGSDYQIYGDTCAGRQPELTGNFCRDLADPLPGTGPIDSTPDVPTSDVPTSDVSTSDVPTSDEVVPTTTSPGGQIPPATQQPTGLGADPQLDALALSCYDGDMAACDELYNSSDPDTDYRRYGDTCAGRQEEGTNVWCRTAFGDGTQSTNVTVPLPPVTTVSPVPTPPVTAPLPPETVPPLTLPPLTTPPFTVPVTAPLTIPPVTIPIIPQPSGPTLPGIPTSSSIPGVVPPPTLQPTGLGTNPAFDALALACFNGDMKSCDDLFRETNNDVDAGYNRFADTCAGRQPEGTGRWCESSFAAAGVPTTAPGTSVPPGTGTVATGIPTATQQPTGLGNDPALNTLAQDCFNGEMQSCDDLFLQSELGSPYHEYGDTCAGRQRPGTYTYCTAAFPAAPLP